MTLRNLRALAVIWASFLILPGCMKGEARDATAAPPAPSVTTARVVVRDVPDSATFTGRVEAVDSVDIRPRVGGYVESVHFKEGGLVRRGDLLFQIDARPFEAEVQRLAAERRQAVAELDLARSLKDRAERLLARNAISREEADKSTADAAVAAARLAAVKAQLAAAKLDLSFTRVTAPIAGRVSRAIVTSGNLVDSSTLLTTVVSDDPVYVYFDADEQTYLEHVERPGRGSDARDAPVYVGLIDERGYPHAGRLDFVDNRVDASQGTIRARAVLDNPDGRFTPGLFARVKLLSPERHRAALVDDRAVGTDLGRKFVLVVDEGNVVRYRTIETGRMVDGLRVVERGVNAGDRVVVNGLQRVRPGMTVKATEVAMQRDAAAPPSFAAATADGYGAAGEDRGGQE